MAAAGLPPVEWLVSDAPVAYEAALAAMDARVAAIAAGRAAEQVWLLRAPPALHRRHQRPAGAADRGPLPGAPGRARRPVHLSRPRPARGLCRCSTSTGESPTCAPSSPRWRNGSSARSPPSTCAASGATTASASGCAGPTRATATRTRSPPSASACAAGSRCTASRSTSSRSCRISPASCPAAYRNRAMASPASPISACRSSMAEVDMLLRREFEALFGPTVPGAAHTVGSTANASP